MYHPDPDLIYCIIYKSSSRLEGLSLIGESFLTAVSGLSLYTSLLLSWRIQLYGMHREPVLRFQPCLLNLGPWNPLGDGRSLDSDTVSTISYILSKSSSREVLAR